MGLFTFLLGDWINRAKGRRGEAFVRGNLEKLDREHYRVLNDILLPSNGNTPTTQIDHVVVSNYGIFCIETKEYSGWIFGDANQAYWTQIIYHFRDRFFNPLRQNYAHILAIEDLIKQHYPQITIIPFIVFPSASKLKVSGTDKVGFVRDLIRTIMRYDMLILTDGERDDIYQLILDANIKGDEPRKTHEREARIVKRAY